MILKPKIIDLVVKPKIAKIILEKKIEHNFNPSIPSLFRIVNSLSSQDSRGKTSLSLETNLNYTRLAKHIVWLEKKGLAESKIKDNKISIGLTPNGREFALAIAKIVPYISQKEL